MDNKLTNKKDFKFSVIITNYNGRLILEKNLPLVIEAGKNDLNKVGEIIVVDDASKDESVEFVKKTFPEVRVIAHKKNRGFSASTNTGARSAKYPLLALLNSDVSVTNNFLETTLPIFNNETVFAVSLHEEGFGYARGKFENGYLIHNGGEEANEIKNTFWVNGGSGIFRRDYWMQLGGMDEKLFSPFYWEDVDLGYRALKRGYKLLWNPNSKVVHNHETTMQQIPERFRRIIQERNQLIFIWKNITSPNLFKKHIFSLLARIAKHPGYLIVIFKALVKIGRILKARKKERRESRVSDEAIFASFSQ